MHEHAPNMRVLQWTKVSGTHDHTVPAATLMAQHEKTLCKYWTTSGCNIGGLVFVEGLEEETAVEEHSLLSGCVFRCVEAARGLCLSSIRQMCSDWLAKIRPQKTTWPGKTGLFVQEAAAEVSMTLTVKALIYFFNFHFSTVRLSFSFTHFCDFFLVSFFFPSSPQNA